MGDKNLGRDSEDVRKPEDASRGCGAVGPLWIGVYLHESVVFNKFDLDLVQEVEVHGAVVAPTHLWLNVRELDPGQQAGRDEDVVDPRAIVRLSRGQLCVPAWKARSKEMGRSVIEVYLIIIYQESRTRGSHVYMPFRPGQNARTTSTIHGSPAPAPSLLGRVDAKQSSGGTTTKSPFSSVGMRKSRNHLRYGGP